MFENKNKKTIEQYKLNKKISEENPIKKIDLSKLNGISIIKNKISHINNSGSFNKRNYNDFNKK